MTAVIARPDTINDFCSVPQQSLGAGYTKRKTATMEIIFLLIGISALIGTAFLILFVRAVSAGQYEDTYTPSVRMLFDDETEKNQTGGESKTTERAAE